MPPADKTKSNSKKMSVPKAFKLLGLSENASVDEINKKFQERLTEVQTKYIEMPDRMVQEADQLYSAYRSAYLSKEDANEDAMLPLTLEGPDTMLNMFGINDLPHQSLKVSMQSQAHYRDGKLVTKASNKNESFINKDGKRETKVYENGKLVKHTIDGKDMLQK